MKAEFKPRINLEGRTPLETVIPLQTPYVVFVDPASACNFNCKFCPTGHRDLIQKRLKQVMVETVDQCDPNPCPVELFGDSESAKAPPDDDDVRQRLVFYHWVQGRH